MTAVELIRHLQLEADELRKQKKRQNVTGLHKSVQLRNSLCSLSFVYVGKFFKISSLVDYRLKSRVDILGLKSVSYQDILIYCYV